MNVLVEQAYHQLLALSREILIPQVEVVGCGVFQVRVATFVVVLVDDVVGYNLEEARPVDGLVVRQSEVRIAVYVPFDVGIGQPVGVALLSSVCVSVGHKLKGVSLSCVLSSKSCYYLPLACCQSGLSVAGSNLLCCTVVHGVGERIALQAQAYAVVVVPVAALELVVGRVLGLIVRLESVFMVVAVSFLVAVQASGIDVESCVSGLNLVAQV